MRKLVALVHRSSYTNIPVSEIIYILAHQVSRYINAETV